jgi:ERCC4-type nuclease
MPKDKEKTSNDKYGLVGQPDATDPLKENRLFLDYHEDMDTVEAFIYCHSFYEKFDYFTLKTKAHLLHGSDFCYGQILGCEHKQMDDFIASIYDGRIWNEAYLIAKNFKYGCFVMSFDLGQVKPFYDKNGKEVNRKKIMTILADIQIRYGIYSQFCGDLENMAYFCLNLAYKIRKQVKPRWTMYRPKPNLEDEKIVILSGFQGLKDALAVRLLKRFGSLRAIFNVDEPERFMSIPGIGKGKAQHIIDVVKEFQPLIDKYLPDDQKILNKYKPLRKKKMKPMNDDVDLNES